VSVADKDGYTPLHLAAKEGHVECVKKLITPSKRELFE